MSENTQNSFKDHENKADIDFIMSYLQENLQVQRCDSGAEAILRKQFHEIPTEDLSRRQFYILSLKK